MKYLASTLLVSLALVLPACGPKSDVPFTPQESAYFLAQDKVIDVDGVKVRYRDEGPQDGRAIVMVHGFTSSLETWDALANDLKSEFRVIRLDLPGHGLTGPDPQARYTNEESVQFLEGFLEAINVDKPILVGSSLGGLLSWRVAANSDDLVSKLILIAPGGFPINGVGDDPVAVPMMVKLYLTKAPETGVNQATSVLFSDPSKLSVKRQKEVRDMMLVPGNGDALLARAASFTLPDPTPDLAMVNVPSLLIWGQDDIMIPVTQAEKFVTAMPDAELIIYPNMGHLPQEESPEVVAKDVRKFLTDQE